MWAEDDGDDDHHAAAEDGNGDNGRDTDCNDHDHNGSKFRYVACDLGSLYEYPRYVARAVCFQSSVAGSTISVRHVSL